MSVPVRLPLFALAIIALAPGVAQGAPILTGSIACESGAPNCSRVVIDPVSATLDGVFTLDNDVALFEFTLGAGLFTFNAATLSAATVFDGVDATGFDPILALYMDGVQLTFLDASGQPTPALALSPDFDADAALPALTLAGEATYTLALTQYGNFPSGAVPTLAGGFDQDSFPCFTFDFSTDCTGGAGSLFESQIRAGLGLAPQTGNFSLALSIAAVDSQPIPEPGTLTLMAIGSAGAALARRRARRVPR